MPFASLRRLGFGLTLVAAMSSIAHAQSPGGDSPQWFRGNTHTHSWWSDGDSPPEAVVAWYKQHGYHFLVLTDHNTMADQLRMYAPGNDARRAAAEQYEKTFGPHWVEKAAGKDGTEYRLSQLSEFRSLFEEPGRFLLMPGEEITDKVQGRPVHVCALNIRELIPPLHGETIEDGFRNNLAAVRVQSLRLGVPMLAQVNHPNWDYHITAEDILPIADARFFEIYNGSTGCSNEGDAEHPPMDRLWDIMLTRRLAELRLPPIYAVAADDAHDFTRTSSEISNPGRGWVMVRSRYLTPGHLIRAMEHGDFYASTGVVLEEIAFRDGTLRLQIAPKDGVTYRTQFIGTVAGYDRESRPGTTQPDKRMTRIYSADIGRVLDEQTGTNPAYRLSGREIYVRAKVIASTKHPNPITIGEYEVAWTQPVMPRP